MAKLGRVLRRLDRRPLPVHLTTSTRLMVEHLVAHTSGPTRAILRRLLDERTAALAFRALGSRLAMFEPMFRNTVSATMVRGGDAPNVIPAEVTLLLDGRLLPGVALEDFTAEVAAVVGPDCRLQVSADDPVDPGEPDMGLFETLAAALTTHDPDAVPIPFLLPAVTDGRWFARLGIQPYGYTPLTLPPGFDFQRTVHAADERIPVSALEFGSDVLTEVLRRYAG